MTTDELRAAGWYPDPSGEPGEKYWDGQTWQADGPPTIPPVSKTKKWLKRLGVAALVVLTFLAGALGGDGSFMPEGSPPDNDTDPEDETELEDETEEGADSGDETEQEGETR